MREYNIVVGQSGGPTAAINASLAGVYRAGKDFGAQKIYGMVNGIQGFLEENLLDLDEYLMEGDGLELLKRTPSSFLGTCRYKLPKLEGNEKVYEQIFAIMEKHNITTFFYIGGNDSMDTIKMISDYASANAKSQKFIGIPKTIDNDLPITDHCPGFGSAAKYIATSIKEVIRDNEAFCGKAKIILFEVMGRHAGWLTGAAALAKSGDCAGVDAVYLPEAEFDVDRFIEKIKNLSKTKSSIVIAVSEGIKLKDGRFVSELASVDEALDVFGHKQVAGSCNYLAGVIEDEIGLKPRVIEFSLLQRSASHIASLTDIEEAFRTGMSGVEAAFNGETGVMVVIDRVNEYPYECITKTYDIHEIANVEKMVPLNFINKEGDHVTEEFITYLKPLIYGELFPIYKDGLPSHLVRK